MTLRSPWRLLRSLDKTPIIFETLLSPITPAHAQRSPDNLNEWSIIEILCHLRDYEEIFFHRVSLILHEEYPQLPTPERNEVLASQGHYQQQELRTILTALLTKRQSLLQVLRDLSEEQTKRLLSVNQQRRISACAILRQAMR